MVGKCLASMLTMYWQSRDILLKEESPTLAASVVETNSNNNNNNSTSKVSPSTNLWVTMTKRLSYSNRIHAINASKLNYEFFSEGRLGKGGRNPAPRERGAR